MAKLSADKVFLTLQGANKKRSIIGGKAYNLSKLLDMGVPIPKSFVITSDLFDQLSQEYKLDKILSKLTLDDVLQISELINSKFAEISNSRQLISISKEINSQLCKTNTDSLWAFRSSATVEDSSKHSFAGQFLSTLNTPQNYESIKQSIVEIYKSMFSVCALTYILSNRINLSSISMAILIQEMIFPSFASTSFTKDPETNNENIILIEAVRGLGDKVVNGAANHLARYKINKHSRTNSHISGEDMLDQILIEKLASTSTYIESKLGTKQDIEWAADRDKVWILQSRPLT